MNKKHLNPFVFWFFLALILIGGAALFVKTTSHGVGLVSDSVNYINGARSIAKGNGYFRESGGGSLKPITNFPPLYSILLAIPIFFGADAISTAWAFSLIFYLLNILIIAIFVQHTTENPWSGLLAALVFLASKPFLYFQVFAMTEPLFFFCTLAAFFLFYEGIQRDRVWIWLSCGAFCGFATLTRYVGIASLGAVLATLLFFSKQNRRNLRAFLLVLASALPFILAWLIRNQLVSGNIANREAFLHPLTMEDFRTGVMIFWQWINPTRYQPVTQPTGWMQLSLLGLGILGILFVLAVWIYSLRTQKEELPSFVLTAWQMVIYIFGYIAVVYITISFLDASVNIEERILYPCYLVLWLILFLIIGWIAKRWQKASISLIATITGISIFFSTPELIKFAPQFAESGYGWAWEGWKTSPAINIIKTLPEEMTLYTNQPEAVSLWASRGAYALLDPIDPSSEKIRPGYEETMAKIKESVLEGKAALVFFQVESWVDADGKNWVTQLCDGLPVIYKDNSEWVIGVK